MSTPVRTPYPGHTVVDLVAKPKLRVAARCSCGWVGPARDRLVSARDDSTAHLLDTVQP